MLGLAVVSSGFMICCQDVKFEGAMMVWKKNARSVSGSRGQYHVMILVMNKSIIYSGV